MATTTTTRTGPPQPFVPPPLEEIESDIFWSQTLQGFNPFGKYTREQIVEEIVRRVENGDRPPGYGKSTNETQGAP
jgi:hypothetical protein